MLSLDFSVAHIDDRIWLLHGFNQVHRLAVPKSEFRIPGRENLIGSAADRHLFWVQSALTKEAELHRPDMAAMGFEGNILYW